MTCPGSAVLSQGLPEKTSSFAEEGTKAHAVAESFLNGDPILATDDMIQNVLVYVKDVEELAKHKSSLTYVETKVSVSEDVWGTADAIVWRPDQKTLYVRDLKYGAGVPVEVRGNLQLKIYALAALLTHRHAAKTINVGVCQPRLPHADGPTRSVDYDAVDLLEFHSDLMDAVAQVREAEKEGDKRNLWAWQETYLKPSEKGCRWCLAAPTCPKLKNKAQELAKTAFTAPAYNPKELAQALDFLPIMEGWIKNVREFAYSEAEQGNQIPGYKLVEKKANRKWKDGIAKELAEALGVLPMELYGPAPMLGVTEIQKLAPGKNDKERAAALAPFVTQDSSGHTLVHETDKRDAIRVDAKSAFATLA